MNEGGSTASAFDITVVNDFLAKAESTIDSFWTENQEVLLTIVGIVVVLSLLWLGIKLWKRATSKA